MFEFVKKHAWALILTLGGVAGVGIAIAFSGDAPSPETTGGSGGQSRNDKGQFDKKTDGSDKKPDTTGDKKPCDKKDDKAPPNAENGGKADPGNVPGE